MMRCPACRVEVTQGPQCRRCRADLTLIFQLEEQRQCMLTMASQFLVRGQPRRALAVAEGVDTIRHDEDSQRLMAVCHLLRGDFRGAWEEYYNLQAAQNTEM